MFSEYAVQPELLANWADYRIIVGQFGMEKGRLISRYPKKWKQLVLEAADAVAGEREFLRITESLKNIEPLTIQRFHQWEETKDWLTNAMLEHHKRPFRCILASQKPAGSAEILCADELDPTDPNTPERWIVPLSVQIPRTPADMAAAIEPLLVSCKRILFIDPYYDPGSPKRNRPLQEFLKAIRSRPAQNQLPTLIEYHTSNQNQDVAGIQANLTRWVKPHLAANLKLTVVRWNDSDMHNRYVVTDRGAVMFGYGLDEDVKNNPVGFDTVSLLDEQTRIELMVDYSAGSKKLTWQNDTLDVVG